MKSRLNYGTIDPEARKALRGLEAYQEQSGMETSLLDLVKLRASQINGCAFCLDMHWKDARAAGEDEARLYLLDAWRESPDYSDRERAALALTEAVTRLAPGGVPDPVWEAAATVFDEAELGALVIKIAAI